MHTAQNDSGRNVSQLGQESSNNLRYFKCVIYYYYYYCYYYLFLLIVVILQMTVANPGLEDKFCGNEIILKPPYSHTTVLRCHNNN
jgi:hypothetical protein